MLQGKTVTALNDNGETYVNWKDKTDILKNLKNAGKDLVILEIVPFEYASVMNMLVGTDDVLKELNNEKKNLYEAFKSTAKKNGNKTTVTVTGAISEYHPFTITKEGNGNNATYTVNYPNFFLDSLIDKSTDAELYNYFKDHIEVRTVRANNLSQSSGDLDDVNLIYISSSVEHKEIVAFNMFIDNQLSSNDIKTATSADDKAIPKIYKTDSTSTQFKVKDATTIWYDNYRISSSKVCLDMLWDDVEVLLDYIYEGTEYTGGKPVPCIVNYLNPKDYTNNMFKLSVLLMGTTNESASKDGTASSYYSTVMEKIKTNKGNNNKGMTTGAYPKGDKSDYKTKWDDTSIPLFKLDCNNSNEYMYNYVYKTNYSLSDMVFGIGNKNNNDLTDMGSAYYRGVVGETTNIYKPGDALAYLLGYKKPGRVPGTTPEVPTETEPTTEPPTTPSTPSTPGGDFVADDVIRVLEIEPCRDFLYDYANASDKDKVFKNIRSLGQALGIESYSDSKLKNKDAYEKLADKKITFKCVATSEFNGMNEDLIASYDLIIIGTQNGTMCTNSSGNTIYNDKDLDGYIYLAYGDLIKYNDKLVGYLQDEYISIDKYISSGSIDKTAGNLTFSIDTYANSSITEWGGQTVIYHRLHSGIWSPLLRNNLESGKNFFVLKSVSAAFKDITKDDTYYGTDLGNARLSGNDITERKLNELLEYVNIGRPVVMANNLYTCTTSSSAKVAYPTSKMYRFVSEKASNSNVISLDNIATSLKGIMHNTDLKITAHSIKYKKGELMVDAPNISYLTEDKKVGETYTQYKGQVDTACMVDNVDQFNYSVTFDAKVGTKYYVKLIVDKNTDGRFKSDATTDDFNEVYSAKIIEATDASMSVDLKVKIAEDYNGMLGWQILVEELDSRKNVVDAASVEGYTVVKGQSKPVKVLQIVNNKSCNLNMTTKDTFKDLMAKASTAINYNITIDILTTDEYEQKFSSSPYKKVVDYDTVKDYLKHNDYTMVVIGFADSYGHQDISDDYGALSCLVDFIENGNSVLFSHDTMTFLGSPVSGITGTANSSETYFDVETNGGWGERPTSYVMTNALRSLVGMDRYSVTAISSLASSELEKANVPKDASGNYIREIQGYSDWFLLWFTHNTNYVTSRSSSKLYTLVPVKALSSILTGSNAYEKGKTTKVEELNRGQISMYPFDVTSSDGTLTVAETHGQYYQLDMEDPEVVVWYTLTNTSSTKGQYCGATKRDAANNFYIYSKGNVTYSGAGHSSMGETSELKLFVNTVIRAALAGNFIPEITVHNGSTTKDKYTYVIFPNVMDDRIAIKFDAFDEDLATREIVENTYDTDAEILAHIGRFKSGNIYFIKDGERKLLCSYSADGTNVLYNKEEKTFYIYNPFPGKTGDALTSAYNSASELEKNMYDCYKQYVDRGLSELRIEATDYHGATGHSVVKLIQHELFPLD